MRRIQVHIKNTRWSTPEGLNGAVGAAAAENNGAKGHAFDSIKSGATLVLLDVAGQGVISRIWITVADRSPQMLQGRGLPPGLEVDQGQQIPAIALARIGLQALTTQRFSLLEPAGALGLRGVRE